MSDFDEFHAHVYFDEKTIREARSLCESARDRFGIQMGRMHEKTVGPHPRWSCQLLIPADLFGKAIPWLSVKRGDLTIFIHGQSGNAYKDHTQHAMWMGEMLELNLDQFKQ